MYIYMGFQRIHIWDFTRVKMYIIWAFFGPHTAHPHTLQLSFSSHQNVHYMGPKCTLKGRPTLCAHPVHFHPSHLPFQPVHYMSGQIVRMSTRKSHCRSDKVGARAAMPWKSIKRHKSCQPSNFELYQILNVHYNVH